VDLEYSELPERAARRVSGFLAAERTPTPAAKDMVKDTLFSQRAPDRDGDQEVLDGVKMTHRFVEAPGDSEQLTWHYVEAGAGETVVMLHGIPDSWHLWHHQIAALSQHYRVIAPDLKGYGQSDKRRGDYRHEGVAEQLVGLFDVIGVERFNLVTHDRGTSQADWLAAKHPERVLRYVRGEQHLFHFHPSLAPQELAFANAPRTGMLDNVEEMNKVLGRGARWAEKYGVSDAEIERMHQEFMYDGIADAVPRYFNASSFRKEWIDRRTHLMAEWTCPVTVVQGLHSMTQPREFYEGVDRWLVNARQSRVRFVDAGHFFSVENPDDTTAAIYEALEMSA
jgi:pimeloyl-ACP methyl ester carboxylesterase